MQVGDYVRTKGGTLWKPNIIEDYDENSYIFDNMYIYEKEEIYKTSPDIIDLIEVGDYVNGLKVANIEDNVITMVGLLMRLGQDDIKSIVTKEQFESIKYEVK